MSIPYFILFLYHFLKFKHILVSTDPHFGVYNEIIQNIKSNYLRPLKNTPFGILSIIVVEKCRSYLKSKMKRAPQSVTTDLSLCFGLILSATAFLQTNLASFQKQIKGKQSNS